MHFFPILNQPPTLTCKRNMWTTPDLVNLWLRHIWTPEDWAKHTFGLYKQFSHMYLGHRLFGQIPIWATDILAIHIFGTQTFWPNIHFSTRRFVKTHIMVTNILANRDISATDFLAKDISGWKFHSGQNICGNNNHFCQKIHG